MWVVFGWLMLQVNIQLYGEMLMMYDFYVGYYMDVMVMVQYQLVLQLVQFDQVLVVVCQVGLNVSWLEICLLVLDDCVWMVNEIDCCWLMQVDVVVIDGVMMQVVDCMCFVDFLLMVKFICWGVDFYMGIFFGLVNQLLLVGFGCVLCVIIGVGY